MTVSGTEFWYGSKPSTAQPWRTDRSREAAILQLLEEHGTREGSIIDSYRRLVDRSTDEGVRYLGQLILDDEERHHRVLEEMANAIRSVLSEVDVDPSVPGMSMRADHGLLEETKRLLAFERHDATELKRLRREMRSEPNESLLPLLVEVLIHDSAKHAAMLRFIRAHTSEDNPDSADDLER